MRAVSGAAEITERKKGCGRGNTKRHDIQALALTIERDGQRERAAPITHLALLRYLTVLEHRARRGRALPAPGYHRAHQVHDESSLLQKQ